MNANIIFFFEIVQVVIIFFFNQLKFFNKKTPFLCIFYTFNYKIKAVCIYPDLLVTLQQF